MKKTRSEEQARAIAQQSGELFKWSPMDPVNKTRLGTWFVEHRSGGLAIFAGSHRGVLTACAVSDRLGRVTMVYSSDLKLAGTEDSLSTALKKALRIFAEKELGTYQLSFGTADGGDLE